MTKLKIWITFGNALKKIPKSRTFHHVVLCGAKLRVGSTSSPSQNGKPFEFFKLIALRDFVSIKKDGWQRFGIDVGAVTVQVQGLSGKQCHVGLRGPLKLDNAVSFVKHGHHNSGHSLHHLRLMLAKHSQIRRQLLN